MEFTIEIPHLGQGSIVSHSVVRASEFSEDWVFCNDGGVDCGGEGNRSRSSGTSRFAAATALAFRFTIGR